MTRPPKSLDLSTSRMPGTFYVPPKARDAAEIARRRTLAPGELILEQQQAGLVIARRTLEAVTTRPALQFAGWLIAASALNSVWHSFAQPARRTESVRRRQLQYAWLTDWSDGTALLTDVKQSMQRAEPLAAQLTRAHAQRVPRLEEYQKGFGRYVGNMSLALACAIAAGESPLPRSPLLAQQFAREQGIQLVESRHDLATEIGTTPTLAQFADSDSDVSVHWRRHAPDEAYVAYQEAQAA
jgi:hypothetical protein